MGKYTLRLSGYQPDKGQFAEGVFLKAQRPPGMVATSNMVASENGYRSVTVENVNPVATASGTAIAIGSVKTLDGWSRILLGTETKIYEGLSTNWQDRSRSTAYATASGYFRWNFAQFNNITLAAQKDNQLQQSTFIGTASGGASFADISGAPTAAFVETVGQFAFVAHTSTSSQQWICSALGNPLDWVPSVTTQCATNTITSVAGPITGLRKLGDNIVIYKSNAIFLGRYVGANNNTFAFEQIPGHVGAINNNVIVDIGYAHIFLGEDDLYVFDGTRPISLAMPVKTHFEYAQPTSILETKNKQLITAAHDSKNKTIYFILSPLGAGVSQPALSFRYEGVNPQEAWGVIGALGGAFGDNSITWQVGGTITSGNINVEVPVYFNSSSVMKKISQTRGALTAVGTFTLSNVGGIEQFRTLTKVVPKWIIPPDSATGTIHVRNDSATHTGTAVATGLTFVGGTWSPSAPERLEVLASGRIFNVSITTSVDDTSHGRTTELSEIEFYFEDDGTE